ncbi:MAG: LuxR C-terminal-related transcriptional regulator [Pseudomonadota bacterium]
MSRRRGRPAYDDVLTPAEWRTLHLVRHGLTNPQIAACCGISLDGVKFHVANIVAKLQLGGRGELKHWVGVPRVSNAAKQESNMDAFDGYLGIGQVSRTVSDVEQAEAWYRDVVGLDHLFTYGKLAFFACGGTRLMLMESEEGPGDESLLYLRVPDITAAHATLCEAGVVFVNAPHMVHRHEDGTEEWMAFFNDPDDRPLALMASLGAT